MSGYEAVTRHSCEHCGQPIREGEQGVNWPWMHENGFYQCVPFDSGFKAEPTHGLPPGE